MSPLVIVLTASALALAVAGWVPRPTRPAPTIVAAVAVAASGTVAVSVLGVQRPLLLVLLGAGVGLVFAIGHRRPSGGTSSGVRRLARWLLALGITAAAVGLVCAGAAGATAYPVFVAPAPSELTPIAARLAETS